MENSNDYEQGVRDGKLASLEKAVAEITADLKVVKIAIYMLYGAIALVQVAPELRGLLNGSP